MTKINIGGFELDSTKLPKEGLDYSKFDEQTKNALSVFDTDNRKGHLSRAELQKAINFFASQDGITEFREDIYGTQITKKHKKDGKIDESEYESLRKDYEKKIETSREEKLKTLSVQVKKLLNEYIEKYKKENNGKLPNDDMLKATEKELKYTLINSAHNQMSLQGLLRLMSGLKEAQNNGYKQTDVANVYQDNNGKYYLFTKKNEFIECDKKGNFNEKIKLNDKGQYALYKYNKNGKFIHLKVKNYQDKTYIKENYCAKVLGLNKKDPFWEKDGIIYAWSNKGYFTEVHQGFGGSTIDMRNRAFDD